MSEQLKEKTHFKSIHFSHFWNLIWILKSTSSNLKLHQKTRKGPRAHTFIKHQTKTLLSPHHQETKVAKLIFFAAHGLCTGCLAFDWNFQSAANWVEPAKQFEGRAVRCRDCSLECGEETFWRPGELFLLYISHSLSINKKFNSHNSRRSIKM